MLLMSIYKEILQVPNEVVFGVLLVLRGLFSMNFRAGS